MFKLTIGWLLLCLAASAAAQTPPGPRARDLGIPFDGTPGPGNAITDVTGVEVGSRTIISGQGRLEIGKGPVRTGVTAILPRGRADGRAVFAGYFAGNGNGDMTGTHWIDESGLLETPILITGTGSVGTVRDAAFRWLVARGRPGDFWYPVVAETADFLLHDLRGGHVTAQDTTAALDAARAGPVAEGNVGGGTGMICNGFKGGTGTASRQLPKADGGYTIGVLVQCNYGRSRQLRIAGINVAREMTLQRPCVARRLDPPQRTADGDLAPVCDPALTSTSDGIARAEIGSIIVIVATDAPLTPDQLQRVARRVPVALGRAGAIMSDGSGDIFLAFSTANLGADEGNSAQPPYTVGNAAIERMQSWKLNPLFEATVQATDEAIINALVAARTMTGADEWTVPALPHDQLQQVLRTHKLLTK